MRFKGGGIEKKLRFCAEESVDGRTFSDGFTADSED